MNSFLCFKNDCTTLLQIHVSKSIAEKKTTCRLLQVFPFVSVALKSALLKLELCGKKRSLVIIMQFSETMRSIFCLVS